MAKTFRPVAILGGSRTPFVRSFTTYARETNQSMFTATLQDLVRRFNLNGELLGDVAAGSVITHSAAWNMTREAVLGSGLHPYTPGYNVQRACGTSLETVNHIALKIASGQIEVGIGGGADTNSDLPVVYPREFGQKILELRSAKTLPQRLKAMAKMSWRDFKPVYPGVIEPRTGMSMGQHAEKMVQEWGVGQKEQDELALKSHLNAAKAYADGFYKDMVFEFAGIKKDSFVRGDTSLEKLGKLKPAFDHSGKGTLTAGNSTPLTDGAAATLLSSQEWARAKGLKPMAYLHDVEAAAVNFVAGEGLLMAPTIAVSRLLQRNGLSLQDFDFYEIHEAFAGQVICTLRAWESADYCKRVLGRDKPMGSFDLSKMNVKGGSVALGHPFAATGSRIVTTLAKLLSESTTAKRGLISVCTAGGMGVAAIVTREPS